MCRESPVNVETPFCLKYILLDWIFATRVRLFLRCQIWLQIDGSRTISSTFDNICSPINLCGIVIACVASNYSLNISCRSVCCAYYNAQTLVIVKPYHTYCEFLASA